LKSRRSLPGQTIGSLSAEVARRLFELPEFSDAETIAAYVAKKDEVQTSEIIAAALSSRKKVIVPRAEASTTQLRFCQIRSLADLAPGSFGVLEPPDGAQETPLSDAELVLVPVVAWDEEGHRLGYGRGYFDRALKRRGDALAVGLALESQRYPSVPHGQDDVPLDVIISERRTLRPRRKAA
jgi:5-formyltetrahydrofolate cyclo-ligase